MSDERDARFEAGDARSGARGATRFDRALEGAVREMLEAEPQAGFQARVLQRIVASGFSRKDRFSRKHRFSRKDRFSRRIIWGAVPLGAAAMVIVAVLLPRQSPPAAGPDIAPIQSDRPAAAPRATASVESRVNRSTPEVAGKPRNNAAPRKRSQPPAARLVVAAATPAESTIAIEPLEDIVPIQVVTIGGADVAHREVAITPLRQVTPLQISPLSTPEGRF